MAKGIIVAFSMSRTVPVLKCHTYTGPSNIHRQEAAFQRHSTHPWMNTSTGTAIPCLQQEQVPLPISTLGPSHCCDSLHGDLSALWPVVLVDSLQTLQWTANTTHKVQQRTVYTTACVLLLQNNKRACVYMDRLQEWPVLNLWCNACVHTHKYW